MIRVTVQGKGLATLNVPSALRNPGRPCGERGHSRDVAGVHVQTRAQALEGAAAPVIPAKNM